MIKFEVMDIPSASLGELNPMPDIKNVSYIHAGYEMTENVLDEEKKYIGKGMINTMLPYRLQDGYDRNKKIRKFNAAVLENDHLKAVFLPELGGRLWSLYDKDEKRELLYVNPVFQPGNLALRNAWFSGGVEFNVGIKGHNPLTCDPLWCAVDSTPEGDILRLYEYERIREIVYCISAWMPDDSKVLYLNNRIENTANEEKHMYWWSNIAVPETKGTRVIVPTDESFLCFYNEDHYLLDSIKLPYNDGIDVSYPGNIPASRDFFYKIPKDNAKWIATANEEGQGLLQCSTQELKGRKLFVWGQGQGGRNWNEWLSEEGSAYIEIQAGLAHTQLEHIPMPGNSVWQWNEAYTALTGDKDVLHGDFSASAKAVEEYALERIGDPDKIYFPSDDSVTSTKVIYRGSGWGAVEELKREKNISKKLKFEYTNDDETEKWKNLIEKNQFPTPSVNDEPGSYVTGEFWLDKLQKLKAQSWYSMLHIGVIKYAMGDIKGSEEAWTASIEFKPSAWAYRNLSMLYKNEYNDIKRSREYILKAMELKKDCRALCIETAMQLTRDGGDNLWLDIYETLPAKLQNVGRIRLCKAVALMNLDRLDEAAQIINSDFEMSDIKEGELSVSYLWFNLYRRIYAKECGVAYDDENKELCSKADAKYPLPKKLDFRMH